MLLYIFVLFRSRLPEDSPLIKNLYQSWARQAGSEGQYELAAKCWVAAGEFEEGGSSLAKRSDAPSLQAASYLMAKAGEDEKARVLAFQAMEAYKTSGDGAKLKAFAAETTVDEVRNLICDLEIDELFNEA